MPEADARLHRRRNMPAALRLAALTAVALLAAGTASGQGSGVEDSVLRHSPVKATLLSTVLPGAGQFYNRKYWKIPVIYGAFAGLGYLVKFNNDRFQTYRSAYIQRSDGDPATVDPFVDRYSDDDLKVLRDFYRRNRDLSYIFAGLVYVLNIVDASVDAHLYYFDISDDLSLRLDPVIRPGPADQPTATLQWTLIF